MYKSKIQNNQDEHTQQQKDFPIICEKCLGDSPYLTMTRSEHDKECKVCTRPFTVYRWKAGTSSRYKKTEICKTCAQVKNVCQVCIHDLEFGLPVQVRDAALATNQFDNSYHTEMGIEYAATENQRLIDNGLISYDNFQPSEIVSKLAKTIPQSKFNNNNNTNNNSNNNGSRVCSYFQKGSCNRGTDCQFKHDTTNTNTSNNNNQSKAPPKKPSDLLNTTLFLGNLNLEKIKEEDIRNNLFVYGNVKKIKMVEHQQCAFVTFETRSAAENAIDSLFNNFKIDDCEININWSKSNKPPIKTGSNTHNNKYHPYQNNNNNNNNNTNTDTTTTSNTEETELYKSDKPKPITIMKPMGIKSFPTFKINPTPSINSNSSGDSSKPYYSSMDPNNYGSKLNN